MDWRSGGGIKVTVHHAFLKIIVKESGETFDILAILFPKDDKAGRKAKLKQYLTSIEDIEQLTGLNFLTDDSVEEELESKVATKLWDGPQ
jgi:DNA/RNA endonuclease G (NUC1)